MSRFVIARGQAVCEHAARGESDLGLGAPGGVRLRGCVETVSCVAQTRDDVAFLINSLIDGCCHQSYLFAMALMVPIALVPLECLLHCTDPLGGSKKADAGDFLCAAFQ